MSETTLYVVVKVEKFLWDVAAFTPEEARTRAEIHFGKLWKRLRCEGYQIVPYPMPPKGD